MHQKTKNTIIAAILLSTILIPIASANFVFAEETSESETQNTNNNIDDTEELTNTFYRPKSSFQSDYEYQDYCKQMYNQGYMDENYEWIPEAQDYINNMNVKTYNSLDEKAREIVDERIKNGDMKPEDSPYITYEERQRILNKNDAITSNDNNNNQNVQETTENVEKQESNNDIVSEPETISETQTEEQAEPKKQSTWDVIKRVLLIITIFGIVIAAYAIYRRQF